MRGREESEVFEELHPMVREVLDARLVEEYLDGLPIKVIAARHQRSFQDIYRALDRASAPRRTDPDTEEIARLFNLGFSTRRISEYYGGLSRPWISEVIRGAETA